MGVWQVTEESQPYVGQWDATTDTFWNGMYWAQFPTPIDFGIGLGSAGFGTTGNGYYGHGGSNQAGVVTSGVNSLNYKFDKAIYDALVTSHYASGIEETKVEPQKPDVWTALQSMF